MKIVGLEEHFATPDLIDAWSRLEPQWQDIAMPGPGEWTDRLLDLGDERVAAMDDTGLDVQVVSVTAPGVQNLAAADAVRLQVDCNDRLAAAVAARPDRLQGFATLATPDSAAAADELGRAVTELGFVGAMLCGRTRERNLDHPHNWAIFEAAEALNAPLYLHPQSPQPAVRRAYYDGLGTPLDHAFATHGLGWHYETGVQLLRLILGGVFDRFPGLQVIVGHWGELVLFYLERIDRLSAVAELRRPVSEYLRTNVYVTPSGMFSRRYLHWALDVVGADRIMFSTDYPYISVPDGASRKFLEELDTADREKIASGNWDRLCAAIRR
ncbi:amidohydrolase family protein [Mycobacterium aquaticum]|uniref:Amidohydrolase n=1 Tax=Mycobacterium aquaticum TaxID=1927124 RepID=A0A1X0A9D1_9MYCO|nr:amidohydrolase family protein [Mycobacterium aquaticum]ORA26634.1 amidohydrolase [Mycobacterium aquaticum]